MRLMRLTLCISVLHIADVSETNVRFHRAVQKGRPALVQIGRHAVPNRRKQTPNCRIPKFIAVLAALLFQSIILQPTRAGVWVTNNPMATARDAHTVTLLSDGILLTTGGMDKVPTVPPVRNYRPSYLFMDDA